MALYLPCLSSREQPRQRFPVQLSTSALGTCFVPPDKIACRSRAFFSVLIPGASSGVQSKNFSRPRLLAGAQAIFFCFCRQITWEKAFDFFFRLFPPDVPFFRKLRRLPPLLRASARFAPGLGRYGEIPYPPTFALLARYVPAFRPDGAPIPSFVRGTEPEVKTFCH